jgi:hypothetical protein
MRCSLGKRPSNLLAPTGGGARGTKVPSETALTGMFTVWLVGAEGRRRHGESC